MIARTLHDFKRELDYGELVESLPEIMKIDPRFKRLIWGNLFPKDYNELGVGNNYFYRSDGVSYEINWIIIQIAKHKEYVSSFIQSRDLIYKYLALGDCDRVEYEIRKVEEELGVSVWTTEMRLMTNSFADREAKSFELLERINRAADAVSEKGRTGYVPLLAHFLYKRSSTQSASSYESELNAIHKLNRNNFQVDRLKYFQFRLNYYSANNRSGLESLLIYETAYSLIDKYMSLLNLLRWMFAGSEIERVLSIDCAAKLYGYVKDRELLPFLAYGAMEKLPESYYEKDFISILNSYYSKDYRETIKKCKEYIIKDPNHFDCIKVYIQSLFFLGEPYTNIVSDPNAIVNRVSFLVYQSFSESDNTTSLADLYDFNKRIYGLPLASGVHCFLQDQKKKKVDYYQRSISLKTVDPLFSKIWSEAQTKNAIDYLETAKDHGITGITIDYYLSWLNGVPKACPEGMAHYIFEKDIAQHYYKERDYDNCISICSSLFDNWGEYLPIGQIAVEYTFRSFVDSGDKMKAISYFVDRYIEKKALVNSIQTDAFMESLRRERYRRGVKNTIDLQIVVFLNATEDEQKAHVLQMFMNYLDAKDMSDLIAAVGDDISQEKQELFFFSLVEGDILRHLPYIESTKQMLEEQQIVVQYLTHFTSQNHDLYEDYNKQILELMISYENIKKLDESRIYVNESAIIKYELNDCENLYRQLASRNEVARALQSVYFLQTSEDGVQSGVDEKVMQSGFKATRNVTTDLSTQIFNTILQKYLFSKFGLKTYLSTRIRHGVLEGQIRSVFDSLHLMLTTQNNRFRPITYWQRTFGLSQEEQESLMKMLGSFSSSLGQIIEDFKANVVQIKTKEEDSGMFEYIIPDEKKCYAVNYAQSVSTDYESFCTQILLVIDQFTEQSLVLIREYIHNVFQEQFVELIGKLEEDVRSLSSCHFFSSLTEAIYLSRESIQKCLAKIEKWFSLQTGVYDDFNLKKQIELVWRVTERQYPNIQYNLKEDIGGADIIVDASHYMDIADMLTILYNNMFSHCKVESIRSFVISAHHLDDYIVLHLENHVGEADDTINKTFAELLKSEGRLQLEGRSGLVKVKKIIKYDLDGDDEDLCIVAENGVCKVDVRLKLENLKKKEEDINE